MRKNAQAALEFLMTYGWAILVVLIVIGALAYFGVLNPTNLLSEKCVFETGFGCKNFKVTETGVVIEIENNYGKSIKVTEFTIRDPSGDGSYCTVSADTDEYAQLLNGKSILINLDGTGYVVGGVDSNSNPVGLGDGSEDCNIFDGSVGEKKKVELELTYYFADSSDEFEKTVTGEMLAKVFAGPASPAPTTT